MYKLACENKAFLLFILRNFPAALSLNNFLVLQRKYNIFQFTMKERGVHLTEAYQHIACSRIEAWGEGLQCVFTLLLKPQLPAELAFSATVDAEVVSLKTMFSLEELGQVLIYWGESFGLFPVVQVALCICKLMEFYSQDELDACMSDVAHSEFMLTNLSKLLGCLAATLEALSVQESQSLNPVVTTLVTQVKMFWQHINFDRLLVLLLQDSTTINPELANSILYAFEDLPQDQLNPKTEELLTKFFIRSYTPHELARALIDDSDQVMKQHLKTYKASLLNAIQTLAEKKWLSPLLPLFAELVSAHIFTENEIGDLPESLKNMVKAQKFFAQHMRGISYPEGSGSLTFDEYVQNIQASYFYPNLFNLDTECSAIIVDLLEKAKPFFAKIFPLPLLEIKETLVTLIRPVIKFEPPALIQKVFECLLVVEEAFVDLLWQEIVQYTRIAFFYEAIPEWFERQITGQRLNTLVLSDQKTLPVALLAKLEAFKVLSKRLLSPASLIAKTSNNIFPQQDVETLADCLDHAGIDQLTLQMLSDKLNADQAQPLLLFLLERLSAEARYEGVSYLRSAIEELKEIDPPIELEMYFFTEARKYLEMNRATVSGKTLQQFLVLFSEQIFDGMDCTDFLTRIAAAKQIAAIVAAPTVVPGAATMSQNTAAEISSITFEQLQAEIIKSVESNCITQVLQEIQSIHSSHVIKKSVGEMAFTEAFFGVLNSAAAGGDVLTHLAALTKNKAPFISELAQALLLQLWQAGGIADEQKSNDAFMDVLIHLLFERKILIKELGLVAKEYSPFAQALLNKIKEKFAANPGMPAFHEDGSLGIFVRQIVFYEEEARAVNAVLTKAPKLSEKETCAALYPALNIFLDKKFISPKTLLANQQLLLQHPVLWQMFLRRVVEILSQRKSFCGITLEKATVEEFLVASVKQYGVFLTEFYILEEARHSLDVGRSFSIDHLSVLYHEFSLVKEITLYLTSFLCEESSLVSSALTTLKILSKRKTTDIVADKSAASLNLPDFLRTITNLFPQEATVEKLSVKQSFDALREKARLILLTQEHALSIFVLLFGLQHSENLMQLLFCLASYLPEFEVALNKLLASKPAKFWAEDFIKEVKSSQVQLVIANRLLQKDEQNKPLDFFLKLVKTLFTRGFFSSIFDGDSRGPLERFIALPPEDFYLFVTDKTVQLVFKKTPDAHRCALVQKFNSRLAGIILAIFTHESSVDAALLWVIIEKIGFRDEKIFDVQVLRLLPKHKCLELLFKVNHDQFAEGLAALIVNSAKGAKAARAPADEKILACVSMFQKFVRYYSFEAPTVESKPVEKAMSLLNVVLEKSDADALGMRDLFAKPSSDDKRVLKQILSKDPKVSSIEALLNKIYEQAPRFFEERHAYCHRIEYLAASIGLSIEACKQQFARIPPRVLAQ